MKSDSDNLKRVRCSYKGRTEHVPEIWLVGRARVRQCEGLAMAEAYAQAVADWFEQSDLATEYAQQQRKDTRL